MQRVRNPASHRLSAPLEVIRQRRLVQLLAAGPREGVDKRDSPGLLVARQPGVVVAEGPYSLGRERIVTDHIESFESVADALEGSDVTDVSGGMAGKVRALLGLDAPAHVFDLDGLEAFLDGDEPGTRIE